MKTFTIITVAIITALFVGCGGGSSSSKAGITAQLVDSPIAGVTYICEDGTSGVTDGSGMFTCNAAPVRFRIGNLQLGVIDPIPSDNMIFPQDLLGLDRDAFGEPSLIILTRLLQSMDSDGDIAQTIAVPSDMAEKFNNCYNELEVFDLRGKSEDYMETKLYEYAACAGATPVSGEDAINHLKEYYNAHISSSSSSSSSNAGGGATSSQNNSSQEATSSSNNSQASHSSSPSAASGTWNIDITFKGRFCDYKESLENIKIAGINDPLKSWSNYYSGEYPFPLPSDNGAGGGITLVDTSYYTHKDDGLILDYYSNGYNSGLFQGYYKGLSLRLENINQYLTDNDRCAGDTQMGDQAAMKTWDIIHTVFDSSQAAAFYANKAFTIHDTGEWINDRDIAGQNPDGVSTLTVTFTPSN